MQHRDRQHKPAHKNLLIAAAALIVLLACLLRTLAAAQTVIDHPYRADVAQYYKTAYNLNTYGVYAHDIAMRGGQEVAPPPDAFVTPGYPLFLALFVDAPPNPETFAAVSGYQALLATLAVLLVLLLLWDFPPWISLPAALLTSLSPHLISAATYMLSET